MFAETCQVFLQIELLAAMHSMRILTYCVCKTHCLHLLKLRKRHFIDVIKLFDHTNKSLRIFLLLLINNDF
jgi:hypothetical protein